MVKSRIAYAIWLFLIALLKVLTNSLGGSLLIIITLALPVISLFISLAASRQLVATLDLPDMAEKDKQLVGGLILKNSGVLPLLRATLSITFKNHFTCEKEKNELDFSLGLRETMELALELSSRYCGKVSVEVGELRIYDLFGIYCIRKSLDAQAEVTVIPNIFSPVISLGAAQGYKEGEEYSAYKSGPDRSEVFEIRDYVPGDSLKAIHWRLSEKLDCLMVKEGSFPIENSILLLMETSDLEDLNNSEEAKGITPKHRDALVEALLSLSYQLIRNNVKHSIGWRDQVTEEFFLYPIEGKEDISGLTEKLLALHFKSNAMNSIDSYMEEQMDERFYHAIYLSSFIPNSFNKLRDSCSATALLCKDIQDNQEEVQGVRTFTPETMEEDLGYLCL